MTPQFWTNDPTVLFNKEYILEFWPTTNMSYEQKINAITRLVILITILGYVSTFSQMIIVVGILTLFAIFILNKIRKQKLTNEIMKEGFHIKETNTSTNTVITPDSLSSFLKNEFNEGTKKNPFSNVLLTQITDDPDRKSAPPAFNPEVDETITKNIKRTVQYLNPEIKNSSKQLYDSLWDKFELDQSNRVFYSTANTRIANDQGAYAKFLYGTMPSGKESNADGAFARVQDNYRYTMH
jgi:hypothetical protein